MHRTERERVSERRPSVVPSACTAEREFLNGDHLLSQLDADATLDAEATSAPISAFTPDVQEQLLVDDLLYAMLGFGGRYLRLTHVGEDGASAALRLVDGVEPALRDLALRLVPLCQDALIVQRFVQVILTSPILDPMPFTQRSSLLRVLCPLPPLSMGESCASPFAIARPT